MFYSPVIISLSFSKLVPMDCVVQKCFYSPTSLGSSVGWIRGLTLFLFPPWKARCWSWISPFPKVSYTFLLLLLLLSFSFGELHCTACRTSLARDRTCAPCSGSTVLPSGPRGKFQNLVFTTNCDEQ